jgi:hypothetical protein
MCGGVPGVGQITLTLRYHNTPITVKKRLAQAQLAAKPGSAKVAPPPLL